MSFTKSKFIARLILLVVSFVLIFFYDDFLIKIPFLFFQLVWVYLMIEQMLVLFPKTTHKTPFGKHFSKHFYKVDDYNIKELKETARRFNRRSTITFTIWMTMIAFIVLFKDMKLINTLHVYFISILFYFFDHFCINVYCPFHKILIRNKCCNSCRIFNWGHFMIFSPLIAIPNFYTLSLFITSLIILIQWEYMHYVHPERFYELSNANLKCSNCTIDCRFK